MGRFPALLLVTYMLSFTSGGFEPNCASDQDYGWPRFHNRTALEQDVPWATYFRSVYGDLPESYPICVYDLWDINEAAYLAAGLNSTGRPIVSPDAVREGDLTHGVNGYLLYHGQWDPAPNGTWVEVSHRVYPTELVGMWVWRTRGSGIWANLGRTIVFPSPADPAKTHADALAFFREGCSKHISPRWPQMESDIFGFCAREKGWMDSTLAASLTRRPRRYAAAGWRRHRAIAPTRRSPIRAA